MLKAPADKKKELKIIFFQFKSFQTACFHPIFLHNFPAPYPDKISVGHHTWLTWQWRKRFSVEKNLLADK